MIEYLDASGRPITVGTRRIQPINTAQFAPMFWLECVATPPPQWVCEVKLGSSVLLRTDAFDDEDKAFHAARNELQARVARLLS